MNLAVHESTPDSQPSLLKHPSFGKIALAIGIYETGTRMYNVAKSRYYEKFSYTITVAETDALFEDARTWLTSLVPNQRQRRLLVTTRRHNDDYEESVSPDGDYGSRSTEAPRFKLLYNEEHTKTVQVDGHRVKINFSKPQIMESKSVASYGEPAKIEFVCVSESAQQAVIKHLQHLNDSRRKIRKPRLKMVSSWGQWTNRNDLPQRPISSVVLPHDQKTKIVEDLRSFLESERRYNDLAVPWHRGYLFHGPPGTGKTSLVKALATEFNLDLWYISLSDLKSEHSLLSLMSDVTPRSLLLLEDIDTIKISHDRTAESGTITMSSLLNALDGVATPHGLITMMTTNHIDRLDSALIRAGRMDVIEELRRPGWNEIQELAERFYGKRLPENLSSLAGKKLSAATVSEVFKQHLDDYESACVSLKKKVENVVV